MNDTKPSGLCSVLGCAILALASSFGCSGTTQLTRDQAMAVIQRINETEATPIPEFTLSVDEYARMIFVDGRASNRAGVCTKFAGHLDMTVFLARITDEKDLERIYRHELEHVRQTCSIKDHDAQGRIAGLAL
jgi:hypothetical protein